MLKKLRKQIDKTDERILRLLVKRYKITKKVGLYKKEHNINPTDKKRDIEVYSQRKTLAKKLNLNPELIEKIFRMIIEDVKKNHRKIKNEKI